MKCKLTACCLLFCLVTWICPFRLTAGAADQLLGSRGPTESRHEIGRSPSLQPDSSDVAMIYSSGHPGHSYEVEAKMKNTESIAGFGLEVVIDPPQLADFSTVRIYVDSLDTCPAEEETCWYYFPIRECEIEPGHLVSGWSFLEAHGASGDTTQPYCDTVRILGLALFGDPILPFPNYQSLFRLGVDVACVPDSLVSRTAKFSMTGELSDPSGQPVPLRAHSGELAIWWSVPGDANNDSLVNVGDVVFLVNYLYRNGPQPCVIEAADPNADCRVDVGDVVFLINFLFREGSPPSTGCAG